MPIFVILFSVCCHAKNLTSLLIWMEDDGRFVPKALAREKYDAALTTWAEMGIGPIRGVFVESGQAALLEQKLSAVLLPEDQVTNIIISTHGSTSIKMNKVILQGLGGFGPNGSFGGLRGILERLKHQLHSELNISLQSCSTACGTKIQIESRVNGLKNELSTYGVKRLSVWGANTSLAFDNSYQIISNEKAKMLFKTVIGKIVGGSIFSGVLIGAAAFTIFSNFNFDHESLKSAIIMGVADASLSFAALYAMIYQISRSVDTKGYLVISENDQTQTIGVDAGTKESVFSTRHSCNLNLESITH